MYTLIIIGIRGADGSRTADIATDRWVIVSFVVVIGYGGFVPRIMNKFGTFSVMTRNGMNDFSDAQEENKRIASNNNVCMRQG